MVSFLKNNGCTVTYIIIYNIMMSTFIASEIIMITFIASMIILWDFLNWGQPTVVHVYNVMYSTHK